MNDHIKELTWEYRYSVRDYHGDEWEDSTPLTLAIHYDLNDGDDREWLAQRCAEHYYSSGGWEHRAWVDGEGPVKITIWLDKDNRWSYNVWCDFSPTFTVR